MSFIAAGLCIFFLGIQLFFERQIHHNKLSPGAGIFKTLTSASFVITALLSGVGDTPGGIYIFVGLLLCLVGDVFLIFQKRQLFLCGIGTFLIGHIAYSGAFVSIGINFMATLCAAIMVFIVGFYITKWLLPNVSTNMRNPVIAYIITICVMVALAAGTAFAHGSWHLLLAATLFMASDVFVAKDRFIKASFRNRAISLPMYYGAQLVFALGNNAALF